MFSKMLFSLISITPVVFEYICWDIVVLFVIHDFNRYTTSVNCCWKYYIATITKLLNTQRLEPVTPQPHMFKKTDHIINLKLSHGCGSLVTPMTLTHSINPIRNRSKTSTETCGLDMFPSDAHLETHFMFDIHISQVIVLHSEEQGCLFCCLFCVQAAI